MLAAFGDDGHEPDAGAGGKVVSPKEDHAEWSELLGDTVIASATLDRGWSIPNR